MRMIEIIAKKRDKGVLNDQEIQFWIDGLVNGSIPDYQSSALLMAIVLNSMNAHETTALTLAMMNSGDVLDLSQIEGIKVDKHSTGGVGDKTSLVVGPMVAACGAKVAKMSGRGLGHTGGTLDKLESIENFNIFLDEKQFIQQVTDISVAIVGQTGQLVPADKTLYALRDVTATVSAIPLIASSIMSKKLASGADTILLDVKYGDGAFMQTAEEAKELALAMIEIGRLSKRDTRAMISDMNQPLGLAIGNALEVKEAIETLKGVGPKDFTELCISAGIIMLKQAKLASDDVIAREMLTDVIFNGKALEKFKQFVAAQGGNPAVADDMSLLPSSKTVSEIKATRSGYLKEMKAMKLGLVAMKLGAGRATKDDVILPGVGLVLNKKVGEKLSIGDVLMYVHHDSPLSNQLLQEMDDCFEFSDQAVQTPPLIAEIL